MDKHNSPSKLISRVFICCLLLIGITSNSQNWVSTEFTPFDSFAINDVVSHDGNLYATYATGFGNVLGKSENDGVTWQELNPTGITGYPTLLLSVGNRLYLSTINIIDSHLYYSTDGGATFTEDINGLPAGFFGGASLI
ncbi:MAG: exo-alpha-sialidase, partial [Psychroserpens sp.]|nr:exo-alpha-sialidase [Psychroserpens sp.]